MPSLCHQVSHSHNKKIVAMSISVCVVVGGLISLVFYVIGLRHDHHPMPINEQNNSDFYFPFGYNDQRMWPKTKCGKGYFSCNSTSSCLELSKRCDSMVDCSNAEDEMDCVCAFRMPPAKFCDKYPDCFDQSDESYCNYCPVDSFNCGNGKCIANNKVCDSIVDCANAMDENFCFRLTTDIDKPVDPILTATQVAKTGFLLRNKNNVWYPICVSPYDFMQNVLASYACVSITANPLASSTHHQQYFQRMYGEFPVNYVYHINGKFVVWAECLSGQGLYISCDDVLCGFNPKLLLPRPRQGRIVGGELSEPGAWPWHAAIYKNGSYACGATLINKYWLISASHCLLNWKYNYYEVQLGMLRRRSFTPHQKTYPIERIVVHHMFNVVTLEFDIVLLKTTKPVAYDFWVRPICLPEKTKVESSGAFCTAIGWGDTGESEDDSEELLEVQVPLTSTCRKSERWLCAGYPEGGRDACQGDSGGPLMCLQDDGLSWYIAGVISAGTGCARPGTPGMYTRVAYFFDWILEVISLSSPANWDSPLNQCPGWLCAVVGGGNCLPPNKLCDGKVDCYDAKDEVNCTFGKKMKPSLG